MTTDECQGSLFTGHLIIKAKDFEVQPKYGLYDT